MTDAVISDLGKAVSKIAGWNSIETNLPPKYFRLNHIALPLLLFAKSTQAKIHGRGIVVSAFSNSALPAVAICSYLLGDQAIFFLNHNHSKPGRLATFIIRALLRGRSKFVTFDYDLRRDSRFSSACTGNNYLCVPHPTPIETTSLPREISNQSNGITISIVGRIRAEKGIEDSIALAKRLGDYFLSKGEANIKYMIAAPERDRDKVPLAIISWAFRDTSRYLDYIASLAETDILIQLYSSDSYATRPSGVISEAVLHGAFPVASGGAAIKSQLEIPAAVGYYVEKLPLSESELEEIASRFREAKAESRATYCQGRSIEQVAKEISTRTEM